jgi:tetratricopeptide (TPR) repeat protein/predicted Ser/Thr protein kinase
MNLLIQDRHGGPHRRVHAADPAPEEAPLIPRRGDEPPTAPTIDTPSWLRPGARLPEPADAGRVSATLPGSVAEGTAERPAQHTPGDPPERPRDGAGETVAGETAAGGDAAHPANPGGPAGDAAARTRGSDAIAIGAPGAPGAPVRRIEQFVLLECIGAGGMGTVFAAFDDKLERKVAIKLVATRGGDERSRQRLLREAQALARLSHPSVVTVYEVGTLPDGELFIAMELVKGQTLRAWQRRPDRTWRDIVATYAEAGRGLAAAHQSGIVHRDFKPDNVLVGDDGRVRVADFGLAFAAQDTAAPPARPSPGPDAPTRPRPAHPLTAPGRFAGTPGYMAPEQLAGAAVDARADQFSFCAALHEALHGELPDTTGADRPAHGPRRGETEPIYPRWLRDVLQRGLARDAGERFATMEALLAELTRSRERTRRHILAVGVAGAILAAGALSAALRGGDPPPCPLATSELTGVWDAAVRQRSEGAILGTGKPFASSMWASTGAALDRYAQRWLLGQQAACEATHVRHVQSDTLLDRRMECLAARRRSLAAAAEMLQRRPIPAAAHAGELLASLGDIEVCADTSVLLELSRSAAPPANPAARARAAAVRQQLASASALLATGDIAAAEPVVAEAERAANELDDGQVRAEVDYVAAHVKARPGKVSEAIALAHQAVELAIASHHDELPADVWLMLARNAGILEENPAEIATWLAQAEAWNHRIGHASDSRRIEIEHVRGKLQMTEEQPRDAVATLSHALESAEMLWGKDDPRLIPLLVDLSVAQGQLRQTKAAMSDAERALALGIAAWGPEYPDLAQVRRVLGLIYVEQLGDLARGERELELALQLALAQGDADSVEVANTEQALSLAGQYRGDYAATLAHAEHAEQIYARRLGEDHWRRGEALMGVGAARFMLKDYKGSLTAYEAAYPILRTHGPRDTFGFLLSNTGETLLALDQLDRAQADFAQALEILVAKLGPQHADLAFPLKGLGLAHLRAGRPRDALPPLQRALALDEGAPGADPQERAEIRWALARALRAVGRDPARARALAEAAAAGYRGLGNDWKDRVREIERWLAAP